MREPEIMRPYAIRHDSGLHVLAAPGTPEGADLVTPEHVAKILKNLLEAYDSVVIDAGAVLDERSMTALEAAEAVMLPVYPEIAALRAVHNLIDYFNDVGLDHPEVDLHPEQRLCQGHPQASRRRERPRLEGGAELPYDAFLYLKAVNEGIPMVIGAPKSAPPIGSTS